MRAVRWDGRLRLDASSPLPRPLVDEALIRVRMAGICKTDLEIVRGYKGFSGILGHEFVGDVLESPNSGLCGQRVCGEINVGCGACARCRMGLPGHCARRTVLGILDRDGAFADFLALPAQNLHPIPASVPDTEAVFVEPLAAAYEILEQISIGRGDRVVVLGDGKLGLLCGQVLNRTGANVTLVGKHPEKLALATGFGLNTQLAADEYRLEADVVVEATGSARGIETAAAIVRPRGTIILKTTVADAAPVDLSPVVVNEVTVVGSRCGPFERASTALMNREVDVAPLVEAIYPLSDALSAMERAARPGTLKVLLDVST